MTICPKCGGSHVRRSHSRWYDRMLLLFSYVPYRCRMCAVRFYSTAPAVKTKVNGVSH